MINIYSCHSDALLKEVDSFANKAIAVLLDSRVPGSAGGGTGLTFDWNVALRLGRPVLLAGGLTPDNVGNVLSLDSSVVHGVDASSALESSPGVKDLKKLVEFAANSRRA